MGDKSYVREPDTSYQLLAPGGVTSSVELDVECSDRSNLTVRSSILTSTKSVMDAVQHQTGLVVDNQTNDLIYTHCRTINQPKSEGMMAWSVDTLARGYMFYGDQVTMAQTAGATNARIVRGQAAAGQAQLVPMGVDGQGLAVADGGSNKKGKKGKKGKGKTPTPAAPAPPAAAQVPLWSPRCVRSTVAYTAPFPTVEYDDSDNIKTTLNKVNVFPNADDQTMRMIISNMGDCKTGYDNSVFYSKAYVMAHFLFSMDQMNDPVAPINAQLNPEYFGFIHTCNVTPVQVNQWVVGNVVQTRDDLKAYTSHVSNTANRGHWMTLMANQFTPRERLIINHLVSGNRLGAGLLPAGNQGAVGEPASAHMQFPPQGFAWIVNDQWIIPDLAAHNLCGYPAGLTCREVLGVAMKVATLSKQEDHLCRGFMSVAIHLMGRKEWINVGTNAVPLWEGWHISAIGETEFSRPEPWNPQWKLTYAQRLKHGAFYPYYQDEWQTIATLVDDEEFFRVFTLFGMQVHLAWSTALNDYCITGRELNSLFSDDPQHMMDSQMFRAWKFFSVS